MLRHLALLTVLIAPSAGAQSSTPDRWQLTLEDGSYIWDIRLVKLEGDQIVYRQADSVARVGVAKVTELRLIRKSEAVIGQAGGVAGALAALTGADDEVYDLTTLSFPDRLRTVQQILLTHPPDGATSP